MRVRLRPEARRPAGGPRVRAGAVSGVATIIADADLHAGPPRHLTSSLRHPMSASRLHAVCTAVSLACAPHVVAAQSGGASLGAAPSAQAAPAAGSGGVAGSVYDPARFHPGLRCTADHESLYRRNGYTCVSLAAPTRTYTAPSVGTGAGGGWRTQSAGVHVLVRLPKH